MSDSDSEDGCSIHSMATKCYKMKNALWLLLIIAGLYYACSKIAIPEEPANMNSQNNQVDSTIVDSTDTSIVIDTTLNVIEHFITI